MKHGVYVREQKTSVSTPVVAESGVPFIVGTAPVHSAESPAALFTPVLCTDWEDAVKKLGYSDDWKTYTICEAMYSHFKLFQRQPIIFCNVLDPSTNKEAVAGAEVTLSGKQAKLPFDAILSSLVVKSASSSESPLVKDTDYAAYYSDGSLIVETIEGGAAKDATKLFISYDKVKTTEIGDDDIVKGIEAIDLCMATVSITPDLIIAPGWSHTSTVQAVMAAKAEVINGILGAKSICDIDCSASGARSYDAVAAKKSATNLIDPAQIAVWPQVKLGSKQFHLSTQLAGLMAKVDSGNDGVPYESPSNKALQCDGACLEDGTDVTLTLEQANILNANGICTALKFMNGFVAWGNYTACYEKLALPLSKIHSEKVPSLDGRRIVFDEDITEFEAALTLFETRPMTDKTRGDCETSCTGACYTGCSGDCTGGCETTCSGECQGSCTGCGSGCANTCEGSCSGGCYGCGGNCTGGCSGSCDGSCSGCSGSCSGGCSSSCSGGCKSSCTVTCGNTGCVGSCLGLCSAGCTTSCQTSCGYCGTNCTAVSK